MHTGIHRALAAIACATVIAVLSLFTTSNAEAQIPPPCGAADLTIKNGTDCDLLFCLKSYDEVFCWNVPANDGVVVPMPPGFEPVGVINTGNNTTYEFITPSPDPNAPWWVPNITLSGCCVDVFFDPAICVMWVLKTTSPPPCQ